MFNLAYRGSLAAILIAFCALGHAESLTLALSPVIEPAPRPEQCVETPPPKPPTPAKPKGDVRVKCECVSAPQCPVVVACPSSCPTTSESSGGGAGSEDAAAAAATAIDSIKDIADRTLAASEDKFEYLLRILSWAGGAVLLLGALASYLGITNVRDYRKEVEARFERAFQSFSAKASQMTDIIMRMVVVEQHMITNRTVFAKAKSALAEVEAKMLLPPSSVSGQTPTDLAAQKRRLQLDVESHRRLLMGDVAELKALDHSRWEIGGPEPRWTASIQSAEGVLHHGAGNFLEAYKSFKRAADLSTGNEPPALIRRASHLYNASCAVALMSNQALDAANKSEWKKEAIELLKAAIEMAPRYALHVKVDPDWKPFLQEGAIQQLLSDAEQRLRAYGSL